MPGEIYEYEKFDCNDKELTKNLEHLLYYSFVEKIPNEYVQNKFRQKDKRLVPNIPFQDLNIYLLRKKGKYIQHLLFV